MIDRTKVSDTLYGVVGFRQPLDPTYAILTADNLVCRSGYVINDNPYAKIEFLFDNMDFESAVAAVVDNPATPSVDETAAAQKVTDFNNILKYLQKSAIAEVCGRVFNDATFIDRNMMYRYAMNKVNTETLPTGFVGYKIKVSDEKNIAVKITRVISTFSGTGTIKLILWNTGAKTALQTKTITINSDNVETTLNWVIDNQSTTYKGDYYIGYLTIGLTVTPYARDYENSNVPSVLSCMSYQNVYVTDHTEETLFDLTKIESTSNCFGLNFDFTVYYDYTNLVINNESLFARAIYLQSVINAIRTYVSTIRSNRNQRLSAEFINRAIIEIEGQSGEDSIRIVGVRSELTRELKSISKEVEKLKNGYFSNSIQVFTLS
jgi:hypothetical protein